jgi:hypothetical protein
MSTRNQMICAWCAPAATVTWLLGFWVLAGFIPPPSPHDSAHQIVALYRSNTIGIRVGLLVTMMGAAMMGPFVAVVSEQMQRIEGRRWPLAKAQLGLGSIVILLFIIPCMLMEAAAFRPGRDPNIVLALNDAGWLPFVGAFMPTFFQLLVIAMAIFDDKEEKVFPRWLGYLNVWVAIGFLPTALIYFFKSGPFAWNGLLAFWLALTIFCGWFLTMFVYVVRAIRNQAAAERAPAMAPSLAVSAS